MIITEGTKTEPYYFQSFKDNAYQIELEIIGLGMNTISLVEKGNEKYKELCNNGYYFHEVWIVFDRDSFPINDIQRAYSAAKSYGFNIAYSDEAFELWYCLHYQYLQSSISRHDYRKKLTIALREENLIKENENYDKSDRRMYDFLLNKQEMAISNAKRLEKYHLECGNVNFNNKKPYTSVYVLVEKLNENLRQNQ